MTNAEIAERLFIGRETVKTHLSNVYAKVGVANRTQLVADAAKARITYAHRNGEPIMHDDPDRPRRGTKSLPAAWWA